VIDSAAFRRRGSHGWPLVAAQLIEMILMVLFPELMTIPVRWLGG
jgi:hypothetical protein